MFHHLFQIDNHIASLFPSLETLVVENDAQMFPSMYYSRVAS